MRNHKLSLSPDSCLLFIIAINTILLLFSSADANSNAKYHPQPPLQQDSYSEEFIEPNFISPNRVDFLNKIGVRIPCSGNGNPTPISRWEGADNNLLTNITNFRTILPNGTLILHPFTPDTYRQDIHSTIVHCVISNELGKIRSLDIIIRAVIAQPFIASVGTYPSIVTRKSSVLLKCKVDIPAEFVGKITWKRDQQVLFRRSSGKRDEGMSEMILPNQVLLIGKGRIEALQGAKFSCLVRHKLTEEEIESPPFILKFTDGPDKEFVPRIQSENVIVQEGDPIILHCFGDNIFAPSSSKNALRWEKFLGNSWTKVSVSSSVKPSSEFADTLMIERSSKEEEGHYKCSSSTNTKNQQISLLEFHVEVIEPLKVKMTISPVKVALGGSVEISCGVYPSNDVSIMWFKDAKPLSTNQGRYRLFSNSILQINQVNRADIGLFQCLAMLGNSREKDSAQDFAILKLADAPPKLIFGFIEQTFSPGPPVLLKCIFSGFPKPTIEWTLDGFPISPDPRTLIEKDSLVLASQEGDIISTLNITNTRVEDGGLYTCEIRNRHSVIRHSARLNIYGSPWVRIVNPVVLISGESKTIHCPVAGWPLSGIAWHKDGEKLPINQRQIVNSNGTLLFKNIEKSDKGVYQCSAWDGQGRTARRDIQINVVAPLKMIDFPKESTVIEGERWSLLCGLSSGDDPSSLTWTVIPSHVEYSVIETDSFTSLLSIRRVQESAIFRCESNNQAGKVSLSHKLKVLVSPKIEPFTFQDGLFQGAMTRIVCGISQGDLPIVFSFLKDGKLITTGSIPFLEIVNLDSFSTILRISNLSQIHSGVYSCVTKNPASQTTYSSILNVRVPPRFINEPKSKNVSRGQETIFNCKGHGVPEVAVKWLFRLSEEDGSWKPLETIWPHSSFQIFTNGSLLVFDAIEEMNGLLMCKIENGVGSGKAKTIKFSVQVPPYFTSLFETAQTISQGRFYETACEVIGDGPLTLKWSREKTTFANLAANRIHTVLEQQKGKRYKSTLVIKDIVATDAGVYVCHAKNALGEISQSYRLYVEVQPGGPENIRVVLTDSTKALIEWDPPLPSSKGSNGKSSQILFYQVEFFIANDKKNFPIEKREIPGDRTQILIENLLPAKIYVFKVSAMNSAGLGVPSREQELKTSSLPPSVQPQNIEIHALTSRSLMVSWDQIPKELSNGYILAYSINIRHLGNGESEDLFIPIGGLIKHQTHLNLIENQTQTHFTKYYDQRNSLNCCQYKINGLSPHTQYAIKVKGLNIAGESPSSEEIIGRCLEDVPEDACRNLDCLQLNSRSIQLNWKPPYFTNGIIVSYRLIYFPILQPELNETLEVFTIKALLHNLEPYTNYSIIIYSASSVGTGSKFLQNFCKTLPDKPTPPTNFQVFPNAANSVFLSWIPPKKPYGSISHYNIYFSKVEKNSDAFELKRVVEGWSVETFIESGVDLSRHKYKFEITSSNAIGESERASSQIISPENFSLKPQIVGGSREIEVRVGNPVSLRCQIIGQYKKISGGREGGGIIWYFNEIPFEGNVYSKVDENKLTIYAVRKSNEGNYSCLMNPNLNGMKKKEIKYSLRVKVTPEIPKIWAHLEKRQVKFFWTLPSREAYSYTSSFYEKKPITLGFILFYRIQGFSSDWERVILPYQARNFTLNGLMCGTHLNYYIIAYNEVGESGDSGIGKIFVAGSIAHLPLITQLIILNTTSIRLNLHSLNTNKSECPTEYFNIKIREWGNNKVWTGPGGSDSERIPFKNEYLLDGLKEAFTYDMTITFYGATPSFGATGGAGSGGDRGTRSISFSFTTLDQFGEMPLVDVITNNMVVDYYSPIYSNLTLIIPVVIASFAVFAAFTTVFFYYKNKRQIGGPHHIASHLPRHNHGLHDFHEKSDTREQLYSTISYPGGVCQGGQTQDISPYATFQLSESKKFPEDGFCQEIVKIATLRKLHDGRKGDIYRRWASSNDSPPESESECDRYGVHQQRYYVIPPRTRPKSGGGGGGGGGRRSSSGQQRRIQSSTEIEFGGSSSSPSPRKEKKSRRTSKDYKGVQSPSMDEVDAVFLQERRRNMDYSIAV